MRRDQYFLHILCVEIHIFAPHMHVLLSWPRDKNKPITKLQKKNEMKDFNIH